MVYEGLLSLKTPLLGHYGTTRDVLRRSPSIATSSLQRRMAMAAANLKGFYSRIF
jgi:hypothetical protein